MCMKGGIAMSLHGNNLCQHLASLLGGKASYENGVCTISKNRNIQTLILGRPASSTLNLEYAFQSFSNDGTALCLAEFALLPQEINMVCSVLIRNNIPITAIHNHWLYDQPQIMYLHFLTIDNPISFATKLSELSRTLP